MWESISGFFGSVYDTGRNLYNEFRAGYEFGDDSPGSGSFAYLAGDYVEDAVSFIADGSKLAKLGQSLMGQDGKPGFSAGPVEGFATKAPEVSMGRLPSASTYNWNDIGYGDPRIQSKLPRIQASNNKSFQSTINPVAMTTRGGRTTVNVNPSPIIDIETKTKLPEVV